MTSYERDDFEIKTGLAGVGKTATCKHCGQAGWSHSGDVALAVRRVEHTVGCALIRAAESARRKASNEVAHRSVRK